MINTREKFADVFEITDIELKFSLEERQTIIKRFKDEMSSVISLLHNYVSELKYMVDNKLDVSAITHLTFGADSHLLNIFPVMYDYHECVVKYLLDDNYQVNHDFWNELKNIADELIKHMNRVQDQKIYFETFEPAYDFLEHRITKEGLSDHYYDCYIELTQEIFYSRYTGMDLMNVLYVALSHIRDLMADIKDCFNYFDDDTLSKIYNLNYNLYVRQYWPEREVGFRSHIVNHLKGEIDKDYLFEQRRREIIAFEGNSLGVLWRDFGHDIPKLVLELRNKSLSDEVWKSFFNSIKRFEEYEKWIEEIDPPQLTDGDDDQNKNSNSTQIGISQKISAFFADGVLKVEKPNFLYFLLLAMWARHLLQSKEIPAFVRMVGEAHPALFSGERTQEKVIMSLQNMNGKASQYFDEYIKDHSTMIAYIDLMYPKRKNGERRRDCECAVDLATNLFLALK